ncbi:MAG TPA: TonB-dependent receptor [Candidatus Acidoferrum sp.]|nr:TonB-dependent receptor [Candidatus Acidoferrum sp.]
MLKRQALCIWAVLALALLFEIPSSAQVITGEIAGTVTDQSGAIVGGATVSGVCPETNFTRTVTSGTAGEYRLSEMPPCVYKVSAFVQGFKTTVRDVTVAVGQETKADFRLEVGQRNDTITVEAASPLVDYSPGVNSEVDTKAIVDLPTEGRDFKSILGLVPGVQRSPGGGFLDVSVNGQRTTTNNYMIDGVPNNDRFYGSELVGQPGLLGVPSALLGNDSISEYTVQQLPTAENGVKGGAAINVTLKSGTNGFHGTAFYFGDYDWLNAKNFFSSTATPYHNHNYGGTLSGPIIKDRTFFFVNFEAQRNKSLAPYTTILPTTGDLQAVQNFFNCTPGNTASCPVDPTLGTPIITNTNNLPMNTAGLALLKYYPCSDGAGGTVPCNMSAGNSAVQPGGFTQTVLLPDINTLPASFIVKIDHKLNSKMSLSGRYLYADSLQSGPAFGYTIPPAAGSGLNTDGFNSRVPTRVQFAGGNFIYNIAANKILDVRFSWSRYAQILDVNNKVDPKSLGIDTGPLSPKDFGVPAVYASSVTYGNIGGIVGYPLSTRPTQTYDLSTHVTWIKGTHGFKFGGNYQRASTFSLRNRARTAFSTFQFDNAIPTSDPNNPISVPGYDVFLTQLLLGRMDRAARSFGDTSRELYQPSLGLFFQDEWKATPRVTISYGLRWDLNGALGDTGKRASNFFPCAAPEPTVCAPGGQPNGLVQVGSPGLPRLYNLDYRDFGPRAGLAWDIFGNGKTALRVGYAMAYDVANFAAISAPYLYQGARAGAFTNSDLGVFSVTANGNQCPGFNDPVNGCQPGLSTLFEAFGPNTCYNPATNTSSPDWVCFGPQAGSPNPTTPFQTYGANPTSTPPFNVFGTIPNLKTPRIQYFNATIQHELFRDNAITVSYVGAHGTNMLLNRQLNLRPVGCFANGNQLSGPPNSANNPTSLDCNRPFDSAFQVGGVPEFQYVNQLTNGGFSRYNSMQVSYRQRNWHGVNSIVNFTWSSCIDTNSVNRGGSSTLPIAENPYNPNSNRGPCDTDIRRNFNTGIGYDFPKWSALRRLGEGWQMGSVATYASGRPWTALLSSGADNSGQDLTYQRPDCIGKPIYQFSDPNSPTITNVPAVFAIPADGTIGTCGRNAFRGPHFVQWDFNLNKSTKITERLSLQLRFEIFNLLNHPNFNPLPAGVTISQKKINNFPNTSFSTYSQTPDVSTGNPFLSQGGPRAGQIGAKIIF